MIAWVFDYVKRMHGGICEILPVIWPHPFIPSPARVTGKKPQMFMAGEGSSGERGRSPLSNSFPLLNIIINRAWLITLFERGTQGVRSDPLSEGD
jgi:hypothetical protein